MFEKEHQDVIPHQRFALRLLKSLGAALIVASTALTIGAAGYHWIAGLNWIDSVLNAAMILAGMGQINEMTTNSGKLFASAYALFCALVFVSVTGVLLIPIAHRLLHLFHQRKNEPKE